MSVEPFEITLGQAGRGPDAVDGETLVGIIVTAGYVFQVDHVNASDVTTWEVGTRITGEASKVDDPDDLSVLVELEVTDEVDLSDEPEAHRVCWFLDGATDDDRLFVGSNVDDTAASNPAFTPTYPSGAYKLALTETIDIVIDGGSA